MLTRRQFTLGSLMGGAAVMLPSANPDGLVQTEQRLFGLDSPITAGFIMPLAIPPVLDPVFSDDTLDYYEVCMEQSQMEIIPGTLTTIWGYNGLYPGPTIKARSGRRVVVRQTNHLPESMSIHLHGGHTPPSSDGHPYDLIEPGGSKDYDYPNNQIPTTLWYHDHAVDNTGRHVYLGLAGFYLMTDDLESELGLPSGENEVPLMIQDRLFNADGSWNYPLNDQTLVTGVLGDKLLVNGVIQPYFEVGRQLMRFRMVNGSNARSYRLALSSGDPLIQIGSDGGLLSKPVRRSSINLAPAERIDVLIDFTRTRPGASVMLKNTLGTEPSLTDVLEFRVVREETGDNTIPSALRPVELIPESAAVRTRTFILAQEPINGRMLWSINRKLFDPAVVDFNPRLNDVEIWEFINNSYDTHPIHIHDIEWQILDINGRRPPAGDDGWKDVFPVPALGSMRVIGKFVDLTGVYVFHCHKLEHEDHAMMAQFEVMQ